MSNSHVSRFLIYRVPIIFLCYLSTAYGLLQPAFSESAHETLKH